MNELIKTNKVDKGILIINDHDLELKYIDCNLYVLTSEVSKILPIDYQIYPLAALSCYNIPIFENDIMIDLLINVLHINESIILKNVKKESIKKVKTYLMLDSNTGFTKIGKSTNPSKREKTIQSEKPTIILFAICEKNIENFLHKKYKKQKVRGEWFDLSKNQVQDIIDIHNFKIK